MSTNGPDGAIGARPSDEELMLLVDGELEESRRPEVEAWMAQDAELRAKVDAMVLVGDLVRETVIEDDRADGVADAVMAKLVDEPAHEEPVGDPRADVVPLPSRRLRHYGHAEPANQNARSIFWLAGIAAAVAFGLFFWSRGGMNDMSVASGPAEGTGRASSGEELAPGDSSLAPKWVSPGPAVAAEQDDEPGHAVEVAAVDFGSHSGSVFYVSAGHSDVATTTAVVWVTEDVGGN